MSRSRVVYELVFLMIFVDVCHESSLEGRGFGFNVLDCDNERSLDNIGFCARFSWISYPMYSVLRDVLSLSC